MTGSAFSCFVGIDWSGAKGTQHRGISVFLARQNQQPPSKIYPPEGRFWSREMVMRWLIDLCQSETVLAGVDFAFSYPFSNEGGFFPGKARGPATASDLWALIDNINQPFDDLYGGGIWECPDYGAYYNAPGGRRGALFQSRRRVTEQHAQSIKSPSPTFNCVGPAGVGTGSLAGMRMLHRLAQHADVWPFDIPSGKSLTLVEIFPSYYFVQAGIRPIKGAHAHIENINSALHFFGSDPMASGFVAEGPDGDDADALISAAVLRACCRQVLTTSLPEASRLEGWIFGVT